MLKKVIGLTMAVIMVFALAACGQSSEGNNESAEKDAAVPAVEEEADTNGDGKTLVAYFSWSGNTKEMASYIAEQTGGKNIYGDLFSNRVAFVIRYRLIEKLNTT
ncbi:MAG: hypothetical protein ACLRWH_05145 [Emergencia sp.]